MSTLLRIALVLLPSLLVLAFSDRASNGLARLTALFRPAEQKAPAARRPAPRQREPESVDPSFYLTAGKVDFRNRYPATLMLSSEDPPPGAHCTAVLLSARLALTAGHCVCLPRKVVSAASTDATLIDASSCAERAHVTTIRYGAVENAYTADMEMRTYGGAVRPHPELRVVLDGRRTLLESHADLAVLVLDSPVEDELPPTLLAEEEVRAGEELVMAGYGYGKQFGQLFGIRHVRKNKVSTAPSQGSALYEQQGAFIYNGFRGGPCYREDHSGPWLVGIASIDAEEKLALTSTVFHRDWLLAELERAAKAPQLVPEQAP